MLKGKTRILATHAIDFVHLADRVVVMKEGEIAVQGTHEEVMKHEIVKEIYEIHNKNKKENLEKMVKKNSKEKSALNDKDSDGIDALEIESNVPEKENESDETEKMQMGIEKRRSTIIQNLNSEQVEEKLVKFTRGKQEKDGKLLKDEDDEKEELDKDIIMKAINTIGGKTFWFCMFMSYAAQSLWHKSMDYKLKNMSATQK
jgi:ABC-type proline/glycine betaine transport system ATPase subunit